MKKAFLLSGFFAVYGVQAMNSAQSGEAILAYEILIGLIMVIIGSSYLIRRISARKKRTHEQGESLPSSYLSGDTESKA